MYGRTFLFLLLMISPVSIAVAQLPVWSEMAAPPAGAAGFARGGGADGILLAGGNRWDDGVKITLDEVWRLRPGADRWERAGRLPRPWAFGAFAMHGESLVVLGGDDGTATHADGYSLSADAPARHFAPASLPPFAYAGSAILDDVLYIVGGVRDAKVPMAMVDEFRAVDLVANSTELLPAYPGGPIIHPAAIALRGSIYVFTGGQTTGTPPRIANVTAAYRYDPAARVWTALPPYPLPVRGLSVCALDDRHLLLAGGHRDATDGGPPAGVTDSAYVFDTVTQTYRPTAPLPYAAMLTGLVVHDGWIYAFGGETGARLRAERAYRARIDSLVTAP